MSLLQRGSALLRRLTERSTIDPIMRRRLSAVVTVLTIGLVLGCLSVGILAASIIAPPFFSKGAVSADTLVNGARINPTYPIDPMTPIAVSTGAPERVAPVMASPTVTATPTLTPTAAPAPATPAPPPTCPPTGNTAPALTGNSVRLGTTPAPMLAACPTVLYVNAPAQMNVPISVTLFFGKTYQADCTISITAARTDARGAAAIPFVVPSAACFRGSILTTGTIVVGTDASADAALSATG